MSNLAKPFTKLDKAVCYDCRIPIRIYNCEVNDIVLTPDGIPINYNQLLMKMYGVCPKCGKTYDIERNGIEYSITSPIKKYLLKGEEEYEPKKSINYNEFGYGAGSWEP